MKREKRRIKKRLKVRYTGRKGTRKKGKNQRPEKEKAWIFSRQEDKRTKGGWEILGCWGSRSEGAERDTEKKRRKAGTRSRGRGRVLP